jgi:hypothetical protein
VLRGRSREGDRPGDQSHLPGIVTESESRENGGIDLAAGSFLPTETAISQGASGWPSTAVPLDRGARSKRYAMWAINGAIQHLAVEPDLTVAVVSTAYTLPNIFES